MKESFRCKVAKFWRLFEQKELTIRELIDNNTNLEEKAATRYTKEILTTAFSDVVFQLGVNIYDKYELILSPEGDRVKLLLFNYWLKRAPEHLFRKWDFHASMPVIENTSYKINMFGVNLEEDDLTIYLDADYSNFKFNLNIFSEKMSLMDDSERYMLAFIFIDQYISEIYTIELIGTINFVTKKLNRKESKLSDLRSEIDHHIKVNKWTRADDPLKAYIGYKRIPFRGEESTLRREIHSGYTSNGQVIHTYLSNTPKLLHKYNMEGVEFGFFYYRNIKTTEKNLLSIRDLIGSEINKQCEKAGIADCSGAALGENYSYIDFIIYDCELFIDTIKNIKEKLNLQNAAFSFFNSDKELISL